MRAANESYALTMNIIVIIVLVCEFYFEDHDSDHEIRQIIHKKQCKTQKPTRRILKQPLDPLVQIFLTQTHNAEHAKGLFHSTITSSKNGKKHQIKWPLTCKSKNICYLINCKHCNQQYTGEAKREFYLRLNSHTSDIKLNQKSTGMVGHFSECGLENIQPIILEKVRSTDLFIHKARKQFYIDLLETEINAQ